METLEKEMKTTQLNDYQFNTSFVSLQTEVNGKIHGSDAFSVAISGCLECSGSYGEPDR